jgi:hypothetical protein
LLATSRNSRISSIRHERRRPEAGSDGIRRDIIFDQDGFVIDNAAPLKLTDPTSDYDAWLYMAIAAGSRLELVSLVRQRPEPAAAGLAAPATPFVSAHQSNAGVRADAH